MTIRVERREECQPLSCDGHWWVLLNGRALIGFHRKGSAIALAFGLYGELKDAGCELQLPPKAASR